MKIAFFTYPEAFQNIGGGEIQLLKTREYLEKAGQPVTLFDLWKDKVESFDILHIFSSVGDTLGLARTARARGVKVCVSTVLWSDWNRAVHTDGPWSLKADLMLRHAVKVAAPSFPSSRRKLLQAADRLFPNSEAEKKQIARLFAIDSAKITPVPNGVDPTFACADRRVWQKTFGDDPFLLSIGRIEPRKNQLNLIRAVRGMQPLRHLHLVGSPVSGYEDYHAACRKEGEGFVTFHETIPHGETLLASAYAACELFILPGWFETPGLAALEAALAGSRLLVTTGGCTREYFGGHVEYCDPASLKSFQAGILRALAAPRSELLKDRVEKRYGWDSVARQYMEHYAELLRS